MAAELCWVLLDQSGRHYWSAVGFRPLPVELSPRGWLAWPSWPTRADALREARRLREEKGVDARPCVLRLA